MRPIASFCLGLCMLAVADAAPPTTAPSKLVEFPSVVVDRIARQVRVACQSLDIDAPLEFFCVSNGGPEHESVLRTAAKPSHIHAGMLMLGMQPGSPVEYVESKNAWSAPFGPPIRISVEWKDANGKLIHRSAESMLVSTKDQKAGAPSQGWIFAGSHQREDGTYLADLTGYIVTLCNFEHALIDVPRLVSSANETLEWQTTADRPKRGEPVTMIIEPIGNGVPSIPSPKTTPTTEEAGDLTPEQAAVEREINAMRDRWRAAIAPHEDAMRDAAKTHYQIIAELRAKQHALTDEADRIDALIDELDRSYQDLTTPKP